MESCGESSGWERGGTGRRKNSAYLFNMGFKLAFRELEHGIKLVTRKLIRRKNTEIPRIRPGHFLQVSGKIRGGR